METFCHTSPTENGSYSKIAILESRTTEKAVLCCPNLSASLVPFILLFLGCSAGCSLLCQIFKRNTTHFLRLSAPVAGPTQLRLSLHGRNCTKQQAHPELCCCHNLQPNSLLTADYLLLPQFPMPSLCFYPSAQIFLSRLEEEHSLQCCAMPASLSHHFTVHRKLFWGVKEKNRNTVIFLREQAKLWHLVWHWNASIIWKGLFEAGP